MTPDGPTTRIWVDTDTGTWGDPEVMIFVDLTQDELDAFDEMGDSERIRYARAHEADWIDGTP